jgi:tRNA A-37 threonylcarbamoyl transferase component Bud32
LGKDGSTKAGALTFGRYRLVEQLGVGGMAVVYRAVIEGPQGFARSVVVKRIRPDLARNPHFIKMLIREARVTSLLHHPSIAQVYEFGECNGEYFLAMEHVAGHDLRRVIQACVTAGRPMPQAIVCHVIAELAAALAYAHALRGPDGAPAGIVHRDVSPSNIMVTDQGAVKLLDFGVAKAANSLRDEVSTAGTMKGKLSYMSPEQAEGFHLDGRSDMFALGIVFHECLLRRRLFRGTTDLGSLRLVREAKVAAPSTIDPTIDPAIDAIVLKMLARDRNRRYDSCAEVAAALSPVVHRLGGDAGMLRDFLSTLTITAELEPINVERAIASDAPGTPVGRTRTTVDEALAPPRRRVGRGTLLIALGVLLPIVAVGLSRFSARARRTAVVAARPVPSAAPSPVAATAPVVSRAVPVKLVVAGPPHGQVLVDAHTAGAVPLELALPSRDTERVVTVLAAGQSPFTVHIAGDRDAVVTVPVVAVASPAASRRAKTTHHTSNRRAQSQKAIDPDAPMVE